jgi:hypothetical protein
MFSWNFEELDEFEREELDKERACRIRDMAKAGDCMHARYKNDPDEFKQRRSELHEIQAKPNDATINTWKLVDTYQDKLYATFETHEELAAFVKHQRSHEYIRCILMDRVIQAEGIDAADIMWPDSIHLIKGDCVFYPRNQHIDFCIEDLPVYVDWSIDQSHMQSKATDELKHACGELIKAGVNNRLMAECIKT